MKYIIRLLYRVIWRLFHLDLYKNPEKYIPNGIYCYEHTGKMLTGRCLYNGVNYPVSFPEVKRCVFHDYLYGELCLLDGGDCWEDGCKICGINEPTDEEILNDV